MNDIENIAENIMKDAEQEGIKVNQGLSRLLLDLWKRTSDDLRSAISKSKKLFVVSLISSIVSALCICSCVYLATVVHTQAGQIRAIQEVLSDGVVIEETTTTTEETITTITQDTGEGSGNNVYQAGESSTYTQSGGDE